MGRPKENLQSRLLTLCSLEKSVQTDNVRILSMQK